MHWRILWASSLPIVAIAFACTGSDPDVSSPAPDAGPTPDSAPTPDADVVVKPPAKRFLARTTGPTPLALDLEWKAGAGPLTLSLEGQHVTAPPKQISSADTKVTLDVSVAAGTPGDAELAQIVVTKANGTTTKTPVSMLIADAPGKLDVSFGGSGIIDEAEAATFLPVIVDKDGNVVVGGARNETAAADADFRQSLWVLRYRPNGTRDVQFDYRASLGTYYDYPAALVEGDNGVVFFLAGSRDLGGYEEHTLFRLDPALGNTPKLLARRDIAPCEDYAESMQKAADGRLFAVGESRFTCGDQASARAVVAVYHQDGAPDDTVADGGVFVDPRNGPSAMSHIVAAGDKMLVAGRVADSTDGYYKYFEVTRLASDGKLDPTFGTNGVVRQSFQAGAADIAWVRKVAALPNGGVLGLGDLHDASGKLAGIAFVRYTADGKLDPTLAGSGFLYVPKPDTTAVGLVLQPDGRFVVAGGQNGALLLERYNADGTLDSTFHGDTNVVGTVREFAEMVADADGRLVFAGTRVTDAGGHGFVARYWP